MPTTPRAFAPRRAAVRLVAPLTIGLAAALALVGWLDYRATRDHLLDLLREQAATVRETVVAAARANRAAAARAESELGERLLDNARLLARLDALGRLGPRELEDIARANALFRVSVYDASGARVLYATGASARAGEGRGVGMGRLVERLLQGESEETITDVHRSRWGDPRIGAGIKRRGGGAIVLNADATAVADLQRPYSLDALLRDIVAASDDVAYVVLEQGDARIAAGAPGAPDVMDVRSPVDLGDPAPGTLQLGLRLDGVRHAERQTAARLALSFTGLFLLASVALALVVVREQYGELSARHAQVQEALRRRERLVAVGELAGTVAHEIRNPLNAIAMSAQRLRREFLPAVSSCAADRDDVVELIHVMESEAARLNTRIQQFLEYSRPPRLAPERMAIAPWLDEIAVSQRAFADARGVSIEADAPAGVDALIDAAQLRHALENIVRNAIEATPGGGAVKLSAWRERSTTAVAVTDSGGGIAPADLPRVFDLYYTTKPDGSGIGLAVAHQVVAAHGGTIAVDSEVGRGTTMIIRLPDAGLSHA